MDLDRDLILVPERKSSVFSVNLKTVAVRATTIYCSWATWFVVSRDIISTTDRAWTSWILSAVAQGLRFRLPGWSVCFPYVCILKDRNSSVSVLLPLNCFILNSWLSARSLSVSSISKWLSLAVSLTERCLISWSFNPVVGNGHLIRPTSLWWVVFDLMSLARYAYCCFGRSQGNIASTAEIQWNPTLGKFSYYADDKNSKQFIRKHWWRLSCH